MKKPIEKKVVGICSVDNFLYFPHVKREDIENILGNVLEDNKINDPFWYQRALVHKSIQKFVKKEEKKELILDYLKESNECLEYIGDATLGMVVAVYLFDKFPGKNEGDLTKYRTRIVRGSTLSYFADKIGLKNKILMSEQVINLNGKDNRRFLEDAFEAFVGAVYYDRGFEYVKKFIFGVIDKFMDDSKIIRDDNYKDILLRYSQFQNIDLPEYNVISEEGKPHERSFTVEVILFGKRQGKGRAKIKKEAEQIAAQKAIERLNIIDNFGK
jgi:ribonuclease III